MESRYYTLLLIAIFALLIVALAFGWTTLERGMVQITGASAHTCKYVAEGMICDGEKYTLKITECPEGTEIVCTNVCELNRALLGDDRVCPSYCQEYCLPPELAAKLK